MKLTGEEGTWAFGTVTVDGCLRFQVQIRSYVDPKQGERKSFLSFPRRKSGGTWEDAVHPDKGLLEEIRRAVGESLKKEIRKELHLPEVEDVQVSTLPPGRGRACALATVRICGLTVRGISIKEGEKGFFINMPQYRRDDGTYGDMVYGTCKAMQEKIERAVLESYSRKTGCLP